MSCFLGSAKIDLLPRALGPNSPLLRENLPIGSPLNNILATSFGLTFLTNKFFLF